MTLCKSRMVSLVVYCFLQINSSLTDCKVQKTMVTVQMIMHMICDDTILIFNILNDKNTADIRFRFLRSL